MSSPYSETWGSLAPGVFRHAQLFRKSVSHSYSSVSAGQLSCPQEYLHAQVPAEECHPHLSDERVVRSWPEPLTPKGLVLRDLVKHSYPPTSRLNFCPWLSNTLGIYVTVQCTQSVKSSCSLKLHSENSRVYRENKVRSRSPQTYFTL